MTALPQFSQTKAATKGEVLFYVIMTLTFIMTGLHLASLLQVLCLLFFMFTRIGTRKENPPYTFIFLPIALLFWAIADLNAILNFTEDLNHLHFEGTFLALIIGVGSRLIPGILGHVEIVQNQRQNYENLKPLTQIIPKSFYLLIILYLTAYLSSNVVVSSILKIMVLFYVAVKFWRVHKFPVIRSSLTWSIWIAVWILLLIFTLNPFFAEAGVHYFHGFLISTVTLLTLMVATRVLQSHGPQDKSCENHQKLRWITALIILAGATRVSAYYLPHVYYTHLAYSSLVLSTAVIWWAITYLKFVCIKKGPA